MLKILSFSAIVLAMAMISCTEKKSSNAIVGIPDILQDRLKGNVTMVETDSYPVDSTGKQGEMDSKTISLYTDSGYAKSYTKMGKKDSLISVSNYVFNPTFFISAIDVTDGKGKKKSSMTINSDSVGNVTLAKSYDSTGKLDVYYTSVTQNKFKLVTGAKGYHADSTLKSSFTNDYDSIFWVGGTSTDSVGKTTYTGKLLLNANKDDSLLNETEVTKGVSKTTISTYKYEDIDAKGNWTKQTTLNEKGKPTKIIKRIITYKS